MPTLSYNPARVRRTVTALTLAAVAAAVSGAAQPARAASSDPSLPAVTHVDPGGAHMMRRNSPDAAVHRAAGATGKLSAAAVSGSVLYGPDVASYQHPYGGPIDWTSAARNGQSFAIVKATELYLGGDGVAHLYVNPWTQADLAGARAAGLVAGSYTYAHPDTSPVQSADAFARTVGTQPAGGLPPVLDLEDDGGLSPSRLISWTHTFLDRLQAVTGVRPMIYTGPYFWNSALAGSTGFSTYPLWEASYYYGALPAAPQRVGGWSSYTLWQYTDRATVAGIPGGVDHSLFVGSRATLAALSQPTQSTLSSPGGLVAGQYLRSANGQYRLLMQGDGNLVVYGNGRPLWYTRTAGQAGARLVVTGGGSATVLGAAGNVLWSTRTTGSNARLSLGSDGNLVLSTASGVVWSNGSPGSNAMTAVSHFAGGQYLHSRSGGYVAELQTDGNLVVRVGSRPLWSSGTYGHPGASLMLQDDGNLVVYSPYALWSAQVQAAGTASLVMQDDGNLVLQSGGRVTWATYTNR